MNSNTLFMKKKTRLSRYKPKPRSISSNLMNMCGRMNLRWRARYGYKPFLTSIFASIYQFMIQKGLKSLWRTYLVEIHRQKYLLVAKAATIFYRVALHFCVFKTSLRKAYQRLGTETSPVIGFNCLLPVGQIWRLSEVTQFFLRTFQS